MAVITTKKSEATITLEWLWTKVNQRCFGSGVRTGVSLRRYLPTVRGGDPNGELQVQLIGDAFLTPCRILRGHLPDQPPQVLGDSRPARRP